MNDRELEAELDRIERESMDPLARIDMRIEAAGDYEEEPDELVNGSFRQPNGTFGHRRKRSYRAMGSWPADLTPAQEQIARAIALLRRARTGDPSTSLRATRTLRNALEDLEREVVVLARSFGWSWKEVAQALGVATQTLHRRYAREELGPARKRRRPNG